MKMTIIRHDDIMSPDFAKNHEWFENHNSGNNYPCCICGKEVKQKNWDKSLHWFGGGALLTDFGEFPEDLKARDSRFADGGDLLCYPVGPSCYRKWLKMKNTGKYDVEV